MKIVDLDNALPWGEPLIKKNKRLCLKKPDGSMFSYVKYN